MIVISTTSGSEVSERVLKAKREKWKQRLRSVMEDQRISQRELGRRCGLGPTSVRHSLQPGTDVTLSTIYLYARELGVSPHWLAFGPKE